MTRYVVIVTDRAHEVTVHGPWRSRERAEAAADLLDRHMPELTMDDPDGHGGLPALDVSIQVLRRWEGYRAVLRWFGWGK